MAPPKGNQFWKLAKNTGRKPTFKSAAVLWEACVAYFEWVDSNPLIEEKVFCYQGEITRADLSKMRAMTMNGLFIHIGISHQTWYRMKEKPEFAETIELVENIIREQKFTGAAADLLNPVIIARDLGLKDSTESTHSISKDTLSLLARIDGMSTEQLDALDAELSSASD